MGEKGLRDDVHVVFSVLTKVIYNISSTNLQYNAKKLETVSY
jgi:hypothetical protein